MSDSSSYSERNTGRFSLFRLFFGQRNLIDASASFLLLNALFQLLIRLGWQLLPTQWGNFDKTGLSGFLSIQVAIQLLCFFLPLKLILALYRIPKGTLLGQSHFPALLVLITFGLGFPASVTLTALNNFFIYLLTSLNLSLPSKLLPSWMGVQNFWEFWPIWICFAILPAVFEEIFFRGFLQSSTQGLRRPALTLLLPAFLFMLYQGDPLYMPQALCLGFLLAHLKLEGKSLLLCIYLHLGFKTAQLLLLPWVPRFTVGSVLSLPSQGISALANNGLLLLSMSVVFYFLYQFLIRQLQQHKLTQNVATKSAINLQTNSSFKFPPPTLGHYLRLLLALCFWLGSLWLQ